jgi:hypothetical protein
MVLPHVLLEVTRMSETAVSPKRYLTVRQASKAYPAFSEAALRWMRFCGRENGFDACVLKVGRRMLIDAEALERWIESHRADPVW